MSLVTTVVPPGLWGPFARPSLAPPWEDRRVVPCFWVRRVKKGDEPGWDNSPDVYFTPSLLQSHRRVVIFYTWYLAPGLQAPSTASTTRGSVYDNDCWNMSWTGGFSGRPGPHRGRPPNHLKSCRKEFFIGQYNRPCLSLWGRAIWRSSSWSLGIRWGLGLHEVLPAPFMNISWILFTWMNAVLNMCIISLQSDKHLWMEGLDLFY